MDSSVTRVPGHRWPTIARAASSMKDVSGSFMASSGVGTQMATPSHSHTREKSVDAEIRPCATSAESSSIGTSGM